MPVLLFTQTGNARPKCASRSVGFDPACILQGQKWLADSGYYVWWTAQAAALDADRWWLVETSNAEAGRAIITHAALLRTSIGSAFAAVGPVMKSRDPNKAGEPVFGRILASGGRHA